MATLSTFATGSIGLWTDEVDINALLEATTWAPVKEPVNEPVFDNLGDFLLHKYNKVK